jgi:ribokinase
MASILVSGLINIETTLCVDGFPIPYGPVRYPFNQINATVSGVGYNIAKALTTLGDNVNFLSIIGQDLAANWVRTELNSDGISDVFTLSHAKKTARSVILYDDDGRRQVNVDLKDIQSLVYPLDIFDQAVDGCDLVSLCNINFSRPMLARAKRAGKMIATDVHTIGEILDDYNQDFMKAADILFMSDEALTATPEIWAKKLISVYGTDILVIGLGERGVLMSVRRDNFIERIPAVKTREVVNTIGAGDALFSAFIHYYANGLDPFKAIRKAILFASFKIGENGAADGFLNEEELNKLHECNSV